jgi:hypothetical protein
VRLQQFALRLAVVITLIVLLLQGTIIQPIVYGQSISSSSPQPQPQLILEVIAAAKLAIVIYFKIKAMLELVQFAKEAWEAYQTQGCDGLTSKLVEKAPEWLIGKVMNLNRNQDWLEGVIGEFGAPTASEALGNILKEKGVSEKICEKIQKLKSKGIEGVEAVKKAIEKNKSKITSALKSTLKAIEKKFKSSDKKRKEPGPINPPIPPQIISVDIPRTIVIGTPTIWTLEFYDPDKDITFIAWDNGDGFDPGVRGQSQGKIAIQTTCNEPGTITSRVFLRDAAGNTSTPYQYSYQCVSSGTPTPPPTQPPPPPPPIDSDNDGIPDNQDQCPYQAGSPPSGCPSVTQPPPTTPTPGKHEPRVTFVNVPSEIIDGVTTMISIGFEDQDGDVYLVEIQELEARFGQSIWMRPIDMDPLQETNVQGMTSGVISIALKCSNLLATNRRQRVILWDKKNLQSTPFEYTFKCVGQGSQTPTPPNPLPPAPPPPPPGGGNTPPQIIGMFFDPDPAIQGDLVTFLGDAYDNETPNSLRFLWSFGDGGRDEGEDVVYIYDRAGVYNVCLTVIDAQGLQDRECRQLSVLPPFPDNGGPPPPPGGLSLRPGMEMMNVVIYDAKGAFVYQLDELPPQRRWQQWNMRNQYGARVPNGVYLAVITVRDLSGYPIRREVRKIVVLR